MLNGTFIGSLLRSGRPCGRGAGRSPRSGPGAGAGGVDGAGRSATSGRDGPGSRRELAAGRVRRVVVMGCLLGVVGRWVRWSGLRRRSGRSTYRSCSSTSGSRPSRRSRSSWTSRWRPVSRSASPAAIRSSSPAARARVGSTPLGERVQRPVPDVCFVRVRRGLGGDRLGDPDREQPRMDAEHTDAVTARLERQVLGQLDDGGLGHRVRGRQRPAVDAGLAGDVDDATATSGDHVRQDELGGQHETADVDVHRRPPLVELDLPQRSGGTEDPGVVDEQIDRTQLVAEVGHRRGEAGGDR